MKTYEIKYNGEVVITHERDIAQVLVNCTSATCAQLDNDDIDNEGLTLTELA